MDYKAILEALFDLFKDLLKLLGLDDEAAKIESEIKDIIGA